MEVDEEVDSLSILGEHLINTILADEPIETVKSIIGNGSPLWFQNEEEGMSPLHAAAYMQNPELARFLIEQGAVWNASESKISTVKPDSVHTPHYSGQVQKYCRRYLFILQRRRNIYDSS